MGKWYKSKIFKGIVSGVATAGILIVSAGTATPAIIGAVAIGTSTGVAVAKDDGCPGISIGVSATDNGKVTVVPSIK
jgi:hypothetical protein